MPTPFLDPAGEVRPCFGMQSMGNPGKEYLLEPFRGTHEGLATQAKWVVRNKIRMILGKGIDWSARL